MTIVYKRELKKKDLSDMDMSELIYFKDNNIAYIVVKKDDNKFIIRKKKIFNNQLIDERFCKTEEQILKILNEKSN